MPHPTAPHWLAPELTAPFGSTGFVLELVDAVAPPMRAWVRGSMNGSLSELTHPALVVAACTRCGARAEGMVRSLDAIAGSPRDLLRGVPHDGIRGLAASHARCNGLPIGRRRSAQWRAPLSGSRPFADRVDDLLDTALPSAYEATRGRTRLDPAVSVEYLLRFPDYSFERRAIAILPPQTSTTRHDLRDIHTAAHVAMHEAARQGRARGGTIVAAVLTITGFPRRPRTADVIVATRDGAFRKRIGGRYDGYCEAWRPIAGPHDAVDGLLANAGAASSSRAP